MGSRLNYIKKWGLDSDFDCVYHGGYIENV